jgi:hypothetical protein
VGIKSDNSTGQRFQDSVATHCAMHGTNDMTLSWMLRTPSPRPTGSYSWLSNHATNESFYRYFQSYFSSATVFTVETALVTKNFTVSSIFDGGIHLVTFVLRRGTNVSWDLFIDNKTAVSVTTTESLDWTPATGYCLLGRIDGYGRTGDIWCGWHMCGVGVSMSRTGHDALWAAITGSA